MAPRQAAYQQIPANEPDNSDGNVVLPESVVDFSFGDGGTKRGLQERHLSMIALAGMIGTGLFLSSGSALAQAGPLGCVLGFAVMGTVTASIAYTSAEMSAFKPVGGGFVRHATMWLDKSTGIAVGWNFWYSIAITMPTEITAATSLLSFWNPNINHFIVISIFWAIIAIVNFSPVQVYGEFEFYFAFLKVALIVSFIIGGVMLDLGGLSGQEQIGFRFWKDPYPLFREYIVTGFRGRLLGFWSTMIFAAFAYGNVQVVAIAGAETRNPRTSIPVALKRTFFRVVAFYVASIFVISLTVPADDERLRLTTRNVYQSPFVIAFSRAGIKGLPSVINAIVLTSAFSSGNSCTFLASRTLHGLALDGHAPSIFLKLNRFHIPYVAVSATVIWGAIAYLTLSDGTYQVFLWLVSLVTTAGILSWIVIGVTYLRFYNALCVQKIPRDWLPYRSPFQPYITYYGLIMNILILVFSGWRSFIPAFKLSLFLSNYLNCLIYPILYFTCKAWFGDKIIPLDRINFHKEFTVLNTEVHNESPRTSSYDRALNTIF